MATEANTKEKIENQGGEVIKNPAVKAKAQIVSKAVTFEGQWARFLKLTYTDQEKRTRTWEAVERTTRKSSVDAVEILSIIQRKGEPDKIVLVKQFRPPTGKYSIEFPAGLVDANETPEQAALRELKEETGYVGKIQCIFHGGLYTDPGLSCANMASVFVTIDADAPENATPKTQFDEGEFIELIMLPLDNLYHSICELAKQDDIVIVSMVHCFALGLNFNTMMESFKSK